MCVSKWQLVLCLIALCKLKPCAIYWLYSIYFIFLFFIFLAFDFYLFYLVIRFFHPSNDHWLRRFVIPDVIHYFLILILEKEPIQYFPFECSVLNKETTGTIFITSLVWLGPWLGIEPGTSRTRSQHYTARLSRRRYKWHLEHT